MVKITIFSPVKAILISLLVLSQFNIVAGKEYYTNIFSIDPNSYNPYKPIDETIALAAPHLPAVVKFEGLGVSFKYKNQVYLYDADIIKEWISQYPQEFANYNVAMESLIKETKVSKLPKNMQAIFTDLRAQYLLIKKTTNN